MLPHMLENPTLNPAFRSLSSLEREVLFRRFKNQDWREIAKAIEESQETPATIRAVYSQALRKLQ
nr:hypothetical protein [Bacilli bacterium]